MKQEFLNGSLIGEAHALIADCVQPGDTVVDATVGNGHDTLFLRKLVGDGGRVIGFDVQEAALTSTRKRLAEEGFSAELHGCGHERMREHVPRGVAAVMFNLGYLPGGDKQVITQVETSLCALAEALDLLSSGGLLSVMCYPGHPGGDVEAEAVIEWMQGQDGAENATLYRREASRETAPFLLMAVRG